MKTVRDLEAFVQATGKPVLLQISPAGVRIAQTLLVPTVEFSGSSFEECCARMADYVEQLQLVRRGPTQ